MKTALLIIGVVLAVACVLSVLFAALNMYAFYNLRDGTPQHYVGLRQKATTFFIVGAVLVLLGAVCFLVRAKM